MRRPMVAGNWKMNGSQAEAAKLLAGIGRGMATVKQVDVVVCPPFILIPLVATQLQGSPITWGAQNLGVHAAGAYTGEVSGAMLKDFGCTYAIVGHSERRALYGETDGVVEIGRAHV